MVNRKKTIFGTVAVCLFLLVYAGFFGIQTLMTVEAYAMGQKTPFLFKRPLPLVDDRVSDTRGVRLSYFGYSFQVPWEVDSSRSRSVGNLQVVAFTSGNAMLIANPRPGDLARTITGSTEQRNQKLRDFVGENAFGSDYELLQTIYDVTPSDVKVFVSRKEDASRMVLLTLKSLVPPDKAARVFNIRNATFQGFQLGDPAKRPRTLILQLFSKEGELEITLRQKNEGPTPPISQADLNRIIATVRKEELLPSNLAGQAVRFSQGNVTSATDDCGLNAYPTSRSTPEILADAPQNAVGPPNSDLIAKAEIDREGKITRLRILRLAFPKAPADLRSKANTQAVESLKRTHFTPVIFSGEPVAVCSDLSVTIDLY